MKTILSAILFSCLSMLCFGQGTGLVTGHVMDKNQQLSLPGATLKLKPGNHYTVSNQQGKFEFLGVPAGSYTLEITYIGYEKITQEVTVQAGKNTSVNLQLNAGGIAGKEVIVLGDRLRGQAKALNQQKNNPNITNIVSADQIGRFPDANVGDAIKRIPGITMQNDQGEARNIIIRGLAPELNSVMLNGDRIPSAEGDNRRVQMDLIPSDMVQTIEVNKTLTPDMDADAIGGAVNLITRAAPNGPRLSATLSSGYNPIRSKPLYNGSLVLGNRFFQNKLGAVISASYNNNDYGSDNVEAVWAQDDFGNVYTEEVQIRKYDVQRIRRSLSAALDYKINTSNTIYLNAMYNWRDDRENRYRHELKDIEPEYGANDQITGFTGSLSRETKGGIDNNRNKNRRLEDQRVQNYSLRGEHLLGSKVDLDWGISFSSASEDRPNERYIEYENEDVPITLNYADPRYPFASAPGAANSDFVFKSMSENHDFTRENELGMKANLRFPFSILPDQKGRLRVGGRLRLKDKKRENVFYEYEPLTPFGNMAAMPTVLWDSKDFQAGGKYVPGTFISNKFLGSQQLTNTSLFEASDEPSEYLAVNFSAKERIVAGYVRWDQDLTSKLSMIAGVRLENTHIDYTGNIVEEEEELAGQRDVQNSYLNVLPGLSFKYDVTNNFILRLAATTSIARPNYYDITPFVSSILDDEELSAGNPELKAAYAWNFDLMAEHYFSSVGILSGGVFYKSIRDFIYTYSDLQYSTEKFTADFPGLQNPVPAGERWTYKQARNGDNVKVYGFEVALQRQLDFLPGFAKGFGVYVNYTYTKSTADGVYNGDGEKRTGVTLPGTAPHMFNASLSFENSRFTARLSGNYAAAYLDELGGSDFDDAYYDQQFFLDANASYKFTKHLRMFAEANNLTNQPLRYYQGVSSRTMQAEFYRPRYNVGFKFDL
ncbi:TonB-dependent receptor [Chitinophaga sp. XS-30]|uniref:TonB-dependent receptor n=1 Tax=Chitinophaga sp. XS-30 TaxID=2604421 RepID=UPI0011DDDB76|nr:TonB-dependent receptor [Chitinophaga sp. XS-30]QEH43217.1 TonB-dependent receptor [Chitinophaga sp. XS-30]